MQKQHTIFFCLWGQYSNSLYETMALLRRGKYIFSHVLRILITPNKADFAPELKLLFITAKF